MSEDPRRSGEMPFLQHLEELRVVVVQSAMACAVAAVAGWFLAPIILEDLVHRTVGHVLVLSPLEALNERIKLTLVIGFVIAAPIVFQRLWSFIVPGLFQRERKMVLPMAASSGVLFALGVVSAYFYLFPLVMRVLLTFATPSMTIQIQIGPLLGFFYNLAIACGLVFQLPLVTMALTALGLVSPQTLLRQWRIAIFVVFAVTALITPGDVVTAQLIMGIPMAALYFVSVGLSFVVARRRASRARMARVREGERA